MTNVKHGKSPAWKALIRQAEVMNRPENHLKYLLESDDRLSKFSLKAAGIFYDFSRQRLDEKVMDLLFALAEERRLKEQFLAMVKGEKINTTERRPALHTAARSFSGNPVVVGGKDVMPEIRTVRNKIRQFACRIHDEKLTGSTGKPFRQVVVIGIGGSYLGTEYVAKALNFMADKKIEIFFLSNVDIHNFGEIASRIDVETTLWVVISKSYTTAETLANVHQVRDFLEKKGLDPAKHFLTVTSKGSPGDDPKNPVLASFHMFDFIGGRFSVTSAVGGVPLSLYLGYERFERFLKGAEAMDLHSQMHRKWKIFPLLPP